MKPQELTVKVNCDLTVTKETAETCLKLVELFVNSHKGFDVYGNRNDDGSVSLYLKENEIVDTRKKQKTEINSGGVVYCKDCKFGTFNGNQRVCTRLIDLDEDTLIIDKNGYCSHGERKEE